MIVFVIYFLGKTLLFYILSIIFVFILALLSLVLSNILSSFHISALIISVFLGIACSFLRKRFNNDFNKGINFSAKKILRLGIILYGFNVTLSDIYNVGITGILLACGVVVVTMCVGFVMGVRYFKLDKDLALLVSVGSAVCGAAAVLAMEGALQAKAYKGIIAVGTVVVFGLIGMFLYPLILPFISLNNISNGFYIGASLHEVANVVAAAGAISQSCASYALIIKMIRVILLAPTLLIVPFILNRLDKSRVESKKTLYIPWFALWFLAIIILHSIFTLPQEIIDNGKILSSIALNMAMVALGMSIDFNQFRNAGGGAFKLAFLLFLMLSLGVFVVVYCLNMLNII